MMKHLLIVADDFGYGFTRNRGIVKCFQKNAISAVSILANCKHSEDAVELAKKYKIPTGLHFNITEGLPLSNPRSISSLLDVNGRFLGKNGFWSSSSIVPAHVENELNAQLDWFKTKFGWEPSHVDGHQHVHVHGNIAKIFGKVLVKHQVKQTRLPLEHESSLPSSTLSLKRQAFHNRIENLSAIAEEFFQECGLTFMDAFIGLNLMGSEMTIPKLKTTLQEVFKDQISTCEFMVHPGYVCNPQTDGFIGCDSADEFSCSTARENELGILTSQEMINFYRDENIYLKFLQ